MKKIFFLLILLISTLSFLPFKSEALNEVNAYLFYGEGCPHCQKEIEYFDSIKNTYPSLNLKIFEIYYDRNNYLLLRDVAEILGENSGGVPFLVIEDESFVGFGEAITPTLVEDKINDCLLNDCHDVVGQILNPIIEKNSTIASIIETQPEEEIVLDKTNEVIENLPGQAENTEEASVTIDNQNSEKDKNLISLPFLGQVDAENFSLPIITLIMAFLDGFNPCAMWVLLFLISLLFGIENKKKLWIFGTVFLIASGLVYFLFMTAWLNLFMFIGFILWVRIAIGLVALASGYYNLKEYFTNPNGGCKVTGNGKRIKVFSFLKKIIEKKNIFVALSGLIILAFAVNLVELVCSLGLPAVYVQILSLANLSHWQYYAYLIFYVLVFIMPATIVFFGSAITLHLTGISTKHSRKIHLVSGIIMLVIGLLMIFKPEWLMFG